MIEVNWIAKNLMGLRTHFSKKLMGLAKPRPTVSHRILYYISKAAFLSYLVLFVYHFRKQDWLWYHPKNVLSCRLRTWVIYQIKNCVLETNSIVELMPINITKTKEGQNKTGIVHTALNSKGLDFPIVFGTRKLNLDKQILVRETQEDHCGSGWK